MNTTRLDSVVNAARPLAGTLKCSKPSRGCPARPSNLLHGALDGEEEDEAFQHRGMTVCLIELLEERLPPLDHEMGRALIYHMERRGVRPESPLARGRPRRTDAPASSVELALTCLEVS